MKEKKQLRKLIKVKLSMLYTLSGKGYQRFKIRYPMMIKTVKKKKELIKIDSYLNQALHHETLTTKGVNRVHILNVRLKELNEMYLGENQL